ncbi:LysE family transporter [Rossellomorea aquimaris]|uniref:LysE family transporter n=1 Tax=Rossellomorea aquimaris TaxID=189382 RepID=UPI0007D0AB60|nr:LysE family transporter [Rossellomorea aquimaris]
MSIFFSYILLGLSLSAPMGPINAAQLDKGIRFGFLHAWLVGIGGMVADGVFMLMIYFGLAQFLDKPVIQILLWLLGFVVLIYTGVESIVQSKDIKSGPFITPNETKGKAFRTGFLMAISNPLSILFWIGIYGSILAQTSQSYESLEVLIYSAGIFIGISLWDVTMAGVSAGAKKWLKPHFLIWVSIISGVVLIGFGLYFGVQAFLLII